MKSSKRNKTRYGWVYVTRKGNRWELYDITTNHDGLVVARHRNDLQHKHIVPLVDILIKDIRYKRLRLSCKKWGKQTYIARCKNPVQEYLLDQLSTTE